MFADFHSHITYFQTRQTNARNYSYAMRKRYFTHYLSLNSIRCRRHFHYKSTNDVFCWIFTQMIEIQIIWKNYVQVVVVGVVIVVLWQLWLKLFSLTNRIQYHEIEMSRTICSYFVKKSQRHKLKKLITLHYIVSSLCVYLMDAKI